MNQVIRCGCTWLLVAGLTSLHAAETAVPSEFSAVREMIRQGVSEGRVPSVAIAVVKNDLLIWAEGFGFADWDARRPATADSIYLLASVSKPITATGLMVLVDRGKIDLDKPANDYLPRSQLRANQGSEREITVRRLANHTSGMQVHYNFYYDNVPPLMHDEVIQRYGISHVSPGARIEYCNLAFGILDYITEVVSAMPWREFMEKNVFDPIGMLHSSDRVRPSLESMATRQYQLDLAGRFIPVPSYRFDHNGASAIWSSARDLSRFLRLHLNGGVLDGHRLLKEETARTMLKVSAPRDSSKPEIGFGVAWAVGSTMGHTFFEHTGGMPGVATWIRGFPKDNAGFVVLINASGTDLLGRIANQLTRALFPDGREEPRAATPKEAVERKPDAFVGEWTGALEHWDGEIPIVLRVTGEGSATIRLAKRPPVQLHEVSFASGMLKGQTRGHLKTQEGYHGPVALEFSLERAGDKLIGIAVAKAEGYFALSHGVRLRRQAGEESSRPKE